MSDLIGLHLEAVEGHISDQTLDRRKALLWRLERELPGGVENATTRELQIWLAEGRKRKCVPKTLETYWCHIVAFYRWATRGRRPHLDYDPTEELLRPKVGKHKPRVAPEDQLAHALSNLTGHMRLAAVLAAGVGMRAAEIAACRRDDFVAGGGQVWVLIRGKGDKERTVPVPPDVWAVVQECADGYLITNDGGKPVTAGRLSARASHAMTAIGLPRLSLHWLRGRYATCLADDGVNAFVIAQLMGHNSVATTQQYVWVRPGNLVDGVGRLRHLPIVAPLAGPASL